MKRFENVQKAMNIYDIFWTFKTFKSCSEQKLPKTLTSLYTKALILRKCHETT